MSLPTAYEVLGVDEDATHDEIRRAYRARARAEHPDRSSRPDAAARFGMVREAYEVLGDDRRRREYDRRLEASRLRASRPSSGTPAITLAAVKLAAALWAGNQKLAREAFAEGLAALEEEP